MEMEVKQQLLNLGWHISNDGLAFLTENGTVTNSKAIAAKALDTDIKDFGEAFLSTTQKQNKIDKIILQIQKVRNIAAPKIKEESQFAPRMLKITLTDGHTTCYAIEISNIPFLNRSHTPPGSKLLIFGAKRTANCFLLDPQCCKLLGGQVPALYNKWELVKDISYNLRSVGSDGAPPWVNFGEKIIKHDPNEHFTALLNKNAKEATNEFDMQRQDAIMSVSTGAIKKSFGGGAKHSLLLNNSTKYPNNQEHNKPRYIRTRKGRGGTNDKADIPQKPQDKVSLFDLIEDKLPIIQKGEKFVTNKQPERESTKYKEINHMQNPNNFQTEFALKPNKYQTTTRFYNKNVASAKLSNASSTQNRGNNWNDDNQVNDIHQQQPKYEATTRVYNKNLAAAKLSNASTTQNRANNQNDGNQIDDISSTITKLSLDLQSAVQKPSINIYKNSNSQNFNGTVSTTYNWKVGEYCMAKYWEDGKYYNAVVSNLTPNTCVVTFNGYGNVEEVLKSDCIPLDVDHQTLEGVNSSRKDTRGTKEFRNNRRPYSSKPYNGNNYYKS